MVRWFKYTPVVIAMYISLVKNDTSSSEVKHLLCETKQDKNCSYIIMPDFYPSLLQQWTITRSVKLFVSFSVWPFPLPAKELGRTVCFPSRKWWSEGLPLYQRKCLMTKTGKAVRKAQGWSLVLVSVFSFLLNFCMTQLSLCKLLISLSLKQFF